MNLTEENFFLRNGYLIKKSVLNSNECEEIKKILSKSINKEKELHEKFKGKKSKMKDFGMVMVCPLYGDIFLKILKKKKLIDPFNKILGKKCIIYAYTSSSMPPNKGNFSNRIHVDCPRFIKNYITNMGCTIALDNFSEKNGATQFLPKSHLTSQKPNKKYFRNNRKLFECKKGSVLFFNGRLFHRGGKNRTKECRHAVTMNFSRHWMKQRFDMKRILKNKINFNKLDNSIKQKLGISSTPPSSLREYYGYGMKKSYNL